MRKLIYAINVSLDGCCGHNHVVADESVLDYYTQLVLGMGLFVYGRKTYELMSPYWPNIAKNPAGESKADVDYAKAFCSVNKVVFSRTLGKVAERDTRIVASGLRDEILKLKQESGKDILTGGVDIPSQLIELGLVDEFRIGISPVIAGAGRRLMEATKMPERLRLKFIESQVLKSGFLILHYSKQ